MRQTALCLSILALATACERGPASDDAPLPPVALELRDVGFRTPESVLHDSAADVYLVSNINGGGRDRDDNGFISRVSPDGVLLELKWIDGADDAVNLSAPKGSAIIGDSLFVVDIDSIRVFDRVTGAPIRAFTVENATALNDLAVAEDGALWVSDMGDGTPETAARTGLHRIARDGSSARVADGAALEGPNGLVAVRGGMAVAGNRGSSVRWINSLNQIGVIGQVGGSRLDGLVRLPDDALLVSSWEARTVFRVSADSVSVLIDDLQTPADIALDARRNRLLIPSFEGNWLRIHPLE